MALETELDIAEKNRQVMEQNKLMTQTLSEHLKSMENMIQMVHQEADANRRTAERIAKQNAEVKYHSKISGSDKAWVVWGTTFIVLITVCILGGIIASRMGDHEKLQLIQQCQAQGGQWRQLGGQDDANKYNEVCVRSGK